MLLPQINQPVMKSFQTQILIKIQMFPPNYQRVILSTFIYYQLFITITICYLYYLYKYDIFLIVCIKYNLTKSDRRFNINITNETLHNDLSIEIIQSVPKIFYKCLNV